MKLDEAELERMYLRLEKPVFNVVYRWVWNRQVAHEIVQETFMKLWKKRNHLEEKTVDALVYQMAINAAKNHRRWHRLRTFLGAGTLETLSDGQDQEADLMERQRQHAVRVAIDALPDKQKQVIVLSHFAGMTYEQIATIAGVPKGTVASRRNTALTSLRAHLGGPLG